MEGHPLRFRFADDEWASRIVDAIRLISERPAFAECSPKDILSFMHSKMASLVEMHLASCITFDRDSAGWTGYTSNLAIDNLALGCDLAAAAYEHFILGHTYSPG